MKNIKKKNLKRLKKKQVFTNCHSNGEQQRKNMKILILDI